MSLHIRQLPVPVFALIAALFNDQREYPHRTAINYPLKQVMLTAQRYDASGRTRNDYESLAAFIERWARRQMRPSATCDECGRSMCWEFPANEVECRQVFTLSRTLHIYFLCSRCSENWISGDDRELPRITGLKYNYKHNERWIHDGKDKLPPIAPAGPLFAGLFIPGGPEPITLSFRAGGWALPHVSRILNTFRFDQTEGAA